MPETPSIGSFGFTGELQQGRDVWLRARWYGAGRGGFGSRDPYVGDAQTPYSMQYSQYGYNNPVSNRDPRGEKPCATPGMSVGQCMEGGSLSFPPPPPPGSNPWDAFVEGVKIALDHEVLCQVTELLDETLKQGATTPESSPDPARPIVVELGYGGRLDNLMALADTYPQATVYGIDDYHHGDPSLLKAFGYEGRIELIKASYTSYAPLHHKADIVVSIAPDSHRPEVDIDQGIENITKPGGTVLVLVDGHDSRVQRHLQEKFKMKAGLLTRWVKNNAPVHTYPIHYPGNAVETSLGLRLQSEHFDVKPWELYIPSW